MEALCFLFNNGFAYSDLRPENILIDDKEDELRVVDYDDMLMFDVDAEVAKKDIFEFYRSKIEDLSCREDAFGTSVASIVERILSIYEFHE